MPHIIVEHSKSLESQADLPGLLETLHETLAAQGIDKGRIKTRALPLHHAIVGEKGADGEMVHITLLLLEGREGQVKQQYGQALHAAVKPLLPSDCSLTLEVRDMVKETYIL